MKYVGIDLHKLIIVLCVMNQERKVLDRKTFCCQDTERIRDYVAKLGAVEAVVEAMASYEWFVALIEPLAQRVVPAQAGKLRVIAESTRKTVVVMHLHHARRVKREDEKSGVDRPPDRWRGRG